MVDLIGCLFLATIQFEDSLPKIEGQITNVRNSFIKALHRDPVFKKVTVQKQLISQ